MQAIKATSHLYFCNFPTECVFFFFQGCQVKVEMAFQFILRFIMWTCLLGFLTEVCTKHLITVFKPLSVCI